VGLHANALNACSRSVGWCDSGV